MTITNRSFLRLPQVEDITGLSRSSIYKYIQEGTFPKQISLGARAVGWLSGEVSTWVEERISASRPTGERSHSDIFRKVENKTVDPKYDYDFFRDLDSPLPSEDETPPHWEDGNEEGVQL